MPPKTNKFVVTELANDRESKNYKYKVLRVTRGNKKNFDMEDIEDFYNEIKKAGKYKSSQIAIEVMGIVNAFTLKYFTNDYFYSVDDYLKGKVYNVAKFDSFEYFDVIIEQLK